MGDASGDLTWIDGDVAFEPDDLVHYRGRDEPLDDVLDRFDLILTGPHATARFPREIEPWLEPGLTRRLQYDFSDVSTSALGRAWAEADERVLFIENPHHRLLFDPNRAHPGDPERDLRECFDRIRREGHRTSFAGVDAVRPVTFAGIPVLREPRDEAEWAELMATLDSLAERGSLVYRRTRDDLIGRIYAAKAARLAGLAADAPSSVLNSALSLSVCCIHDTMNTTAFPSGAINDERDPASRLPSIVSLGNRGDQRGEARPNPDGGLMSEVDVPTASPEAMQALQYVLARAFDVPADGVDEALVLNRPYLGAYEVQRIGRQLRALDARGVVAGAEGATHRMRSGAVQWEFLRETVLGPTATAELHQPGTGWPGTDHEHLDGFVARLVGAAQILRS